MYQFFHRCTFGGWGLDEYVILILSLKRASMFREFYGIGLLSEGWSTRRYGKAEQKSALLIWRGLLRMYY